MCNYNPDQDAGYLRVGFLKGYVGGITVYWVFLPRVTPVGFIRACVCSIGFCGLPSCECARMYLMVL